MSSSLGQPDTALAPEDTGQFLDQMLLGWAFVADSEELVANQNTLPNRHDLLCGWRGCHFLGGDPRRGEKGLYHGGRRRTAAFFAKLTGEDDACNSALFVEYRRASAARFREDA